MSNNNLRYQNGLIKRDAVREVRARMRRDGSLLPQSEKTVLARLGYRPHYIIDTNVFFTIIEYWGADLRKGLIELCQMQGALRLYLLDTVASECRGSREKQRLYDEVVFNGQNPEVGVIYPLDSGLARVSELSSRIMTAYEQTLDHMTPSDKKDVLIAAAAIAYKMILLTRNKEDFVRIAKLAPELHFITLAGGEKADLAQGAELLERLAADFRS
jgi:predicted nucleic acid-binding protein